MIKIKQRLSVLSLLSLTVAMLALAGCDCFPCDAPPDESETQAAAPAASSFIEMAPIAPPAPQDEYVEIPVDPRVELWRPGHWEYFGGQYQWVPGQMIARPSATAIWSPDHWVEHTYGWGFIPGFWQ